MKKPLVSVLIPVHNEEKIIEKTLKTMLDVKRKEYPRMEIIVGSDSNDRTDDIVRKFRSVKLITSKERLGKAGMLKHMYKAAKGEIIIVHDADWRFVSGGKFRNLVSIFDDPKVGGIDDYKSIPNRDLPTLSLGELFVNRFLYEYKIKKYSRKENGILYARDNRFPFIVTIFRKNVVPFTQATLCDDGERAVQMMKKGYKVVIPTGDISYFVINYVKPLTMRSLYKQKKRCALARKQMQNLYNEYDAGMLDFFIPAFLYSLWRSLAVKTKLSRLKIFSGVLTFWIISGIADITGKNINASTKEAWKMRCPR